MPVHDRLAVRRRRAPASPHRGGRTDDRVPRALTAVLLWFTAALVAAGCAGHPSRSASDQPYSGEPRASSASDSAADVLAPAAVGEEGRTPAATVAGAPADAPATRLEQRLLRALRDDDARLRSAAAFFLGTYGGPEHVAILADLAVNDPEPAVRFEAVKGLGAHDSDVAHRALVEATRDGVARIRSFALLSLALHPARCDRAEMTAIVLRESAPTVAARGLEVLAELGVRGLSAHVAELLRSWEPPARRELARCLPLIDDPSFAPAIRPLLADPSLLVRHLAAQALLRLRCAEPGDEAHVITEYVDLRDYHRQAMASARALRELGSRRVDVQRLMTAVADVRVIAIGEGHGDPGTHAFVNDLMGELVHRYGNDALGIGYETPVVQTLQPVLARAAELGLPTVALESAPAEGASPFPGATDPRRTLPIRDRDAAARATAWLAANPGKRLLFPYGQAHVIGAAHLVDQLRMPAVVVLTLGPFEGLLPFLGDDPDARGLLVEFGNDGRWFLRCCREWIRFHPHAQLLLDWLRAN